MTQMKPETELEALVTNYREAINDAIQALAANADPHSVVSNLQEVLGMDGAMHLSLLRKHEAMVVALLAFRAGALDHLLPDTCPYCNTEGREHTPGCYYGMAMKLVPDNMVPIESTASFKLADLQALIRQWAARDAPPTQAELIEAARP